MNSAIQIVIDALGQGYGRRDTPGWLYLASVVLAVVGAISTKDLLRQQIALKAAKTEALENQTLTAHVFCQEQHGEIEYKGSLQKRGTSYYVIIEAVRGGSASIVSSARKESLDDVETYLRSETSFILADFKK